MSKAPITFSTSSGKFTKTSNYLNRLQQWKITSILNRYGSRGVMALKSATPVDSSETANAWSYTVGTKNGQYWLDFHNSNVVDGVPIAIVLQYGHGTGTGGFVNGRDYINPAIQPIFDQILSEMKREVSAL